MESFDTSSMVSFDTGCMDFYDPDPLMSLPPTVVSTPDPTRMPLSIGEVNSLIDQIHFPTDRPQTTASILTDIGNLISNLWPWG